MQYTTLGRTGIRVSKLCFGTVQFDSQNDEKVAHTILDQALQSGINFFDTADGYGKGRVEEIIGRWLPSKRQQVVMATKVRGGMGPGPGHPGLTRNHLISSVEASLRRLHTDYIDLYQMHFPDDSTPIESTLRALDDLVHQGKVRAIGCSNYAAWELCKALWVSDTRNLERFETVQPRYSLLSREIEAELLPLCASEQVGVLVYNVLAGGFLAGKYRWGETPPVGTRFDRHPEIYLNRYWYEANFQLIQRLKPIAAQSGRTLANLAIAWTMAHPVITSVIVGATSMRQLEENLAACDRPLTPDEYRAAAEASVGAVAGPTMINVFRRNMGVGVEMPAGPSAGPRLV